MAKMHLKTVCGVNGVVLNKHLEFLTGERSIKYEWNEAEKTFNFMVKKELVPEDKAYIIEHFQNFYKVRVKLI